MIKEHEQIVLKSPVPEEGLEPGDVGTVVHIYPRRRAYEVEFVTLAGQTVTVATVEAAKVRSIGKRDIAHARTLAKA